MSYVAREDTATSSADVAEVTAMNNRTNINMAPLYPMRIDEAAGAGRPAPTSAGVSLTPIAAAARPRVEAKPRGTASQADPL